MQSSLSNLDPDASPKPFDDGVTGHWAQSPWKFRRFGIKPISSRPEGTTTKGPSIPPEPMTASPSLNPSMNTPLKSRPGGRTGNLSKKSIFPSYVPASPTPEGSIAAIFLAFPSHKCNELFASGGFTNAWSLYTQRQSANSF
ncbi:hypothetical protein BT96DRAFT_1007889 [Gymnopus androsaceus JB14]|uniref:Uncharacterized protein n=1 Tax=Gymnopus androsaceus JB14 TaxID=1447944 RepID=A0A6A4GGU2_9AGAR|nr:hypothetical protein BT96DRAFT_1007889 [Gymnopus androsaceus JB14]